MNSIENVLRQALLTIGTSTATGVGVAYWKGFSMKKIVMISTLTGLATSITISALDQDAHIALKALVVAGTVIGTLATLNLASNYLQNKCGLTIDPKLAGYLTVANIAGQCIALLVNTPTLTLKSLKKMTNDQVKALHAKMTPEAFDQLEPLLQILSLHALQL